MIKGLGVAIVLDLVEALTFKSVKLGKMSLQQI